MKQLAVWYCDLYTPRGRVTGRLYGYANLSREEAVEQIKTELREIESREYVRCNVDEMSVTLGAAGGCAPRMV